MAKKDPLMGDYELDIAPPEEAARKMVGDITGGAKPLTEYMLIPCDRIIEYQSKKGSDFKPWPEAKFQDLVESIRQVGVLQPIVVRMAKDHFETYEILAGEHRWKASMEAGKKTIPAKIMSSCDDEMAGMIFSITNTLQRETSERDKINGWWHYLNTIRYKRKAEIDQLIEEGVLPAELNKAGLNMRQIYRLAKLHDLPEEFLVQIDEQKLGTTAAYELTRLTPEQQKFLIPYRDSIKSQGLAEKLAKLGRGEIEGMTWSKKTVEDILFPKKGKSVSTVRDAARQAKEIITKRLNPTYYNKTSEVLSEALDMYFKKHPECEKKGGK